MKKVVAFFAMLVMMTTLTQGATVQAAAVQAAQPKLTLEPGTLTVEELTVDERDSRASYTPYLYSQTFTFKLDGATIATATAECEVWHYTDGKVHIYYRTLSARSIFNYTASPIYGSIINTDGSVSYTIGDRVMVTGPAGTWYYAIDFRITPTSSGFFSCYEI